jgi:putative oxidoreductase
MLGPRTFIRPLLASSFVVLGYQALRNPKPLQPAGEDVGVPIAETTGLSSLTSDPVTLVQINAGVQLGAGALLALGRLPRASALALAASLVPTTLAGHRFWEQSDGDEKNIQIVHFLKNAGILGGLLMAALDTGGRPSVFWSSRKWIGQTGRSIGSAAHSVADSLPSSLPGT